MRTVYTLSSNHSKIRGALIRVSCFTFNLQLIQVTVHGSFIGHGTLRQHVVHVSAPDYLWFFLIGNDANNLL